MTWKSRLLTSRTARASALSTATAVVSTPSAATPFSDNSKASMVAVSELADGLDFLFDKVNYQEEPGDLLQLHLERLSQEAARYRNSRLADDQGEAWTCSHDTAQLLYAACQCSCLVYDAQAKPGPELTPVISRTPSVTGTTKAVAIWKLEASNTLIVSIRGTAGAADHMVNMNAEPEDASLVLGFPAKMHAHKGFLSCAKALMPYLTREVARQVEADPALSHVVFTGHSAGGSVASLLFLHFVYSGPRSLSTLTKSLMAFGPAPTTSTPVTERVKKQSGVGCVLAVVSEFDMVSRADRPYMRSIVDLYRTRYGLPCRSTDLEAASMSCADADPYWPLPPPSYHLVGDVILSRRTLQTMRPTSETASETTIGPVSSLSFIHVSLSTFHTLVFCDIGVHKRRAYLERARILATANADDVGLVSDSETLYSRGACNQAPTGEPEGPREHK